MYVFRIPWVDIRKQASEMTSNNFVDQLGYLFYVTSPNKTSFATPEEVPDYTVQVIPHFALFILLEQCFLLYMKKPTLRLNDAAGSVSQGLFQELTKLVVWNVQLVSYIYIYENWRLATLPWDSPWTWWFCFLGVDFCYYWLHRASHEINILWASHQVHHSSEDYNLSTALRQSIVQNYCVWVFNLPLAFLIPPSVFLVHTQLNLLYQFWIHTEAITSLGPLEYVLNTPSHHRVHHGRNRYCIDKNYAGVLIIWDRMFGTFQAEKEQVAYGLTHPINSFELFYIQNILLRIMAYRSAVHETTGYSPSQMLFGRDLRLPCDLLFGRPPDAPSSPEEYVQDLQARFEAVHNFARERVNTATEKMKIRYDARATGHQFNEGDKFLHYFHIWKTFWATKGFWNKLSVIFKGPGWSPGTPWHGNVEDIPEVKTPIKKFDPPLPLWCKLYVSFQILVLATGYFEVASNAESLSQTLMWGFVLFEVFSLSVLGILLEGRLYAQWIELIRCFVYLTVDYFLLFTSDRYEMFTSLQLWIIFFLRTVFVISFIFWLQYCLRSVTVKMHKKKNEKT